MSIFFHDTIILLRFLVEIIFDTNVLKRLLVEIFLTPLFLKDIWWQFRRDSNGHPWAPWDWFGYGMGHVQAVLKGSPWSQQMTDGSLTASQTSMLG